LQKDKARELEKLKKIRDILIFQSKRMKVWKPMPHEKLLKWKRNYHRPGVSHHYIGRDLKENK